jgi:two-component system response regulator GlrR
MRNMVGDDRAFRRLVASLPRMAASDATVLITGETGTGKELYARAIHHLGPRHDRPFVAVDCGAFPDHLLESELFGHAAGAFTDARGEHRGLARMAEGGVLFLDEVDGLSMAAQGKLLRFLQERTFKPLGDERARQADVRVVAATNRDLPALVKEHRFRADLYFRFSVLPVHIMPLRERRADIPLLARHFVEEHAANAGGRELSFTEAALQRLAAHDFPGNVRELYNLVQRAAVMVDGETIDVPDLVALGLCAPTAAVTSSATFRLAKARAVEEFERDFVARLLDKHGGNITRASREASTDRRAFGRLVKKHGLQGAKEAAGAPGPG